ncbi:hypothetical protein SPRG_19095 [Saprolegnia parasitica CBS 223.65]|uniref:Sec16 Sec23-binding domain-containing protein n=1 Tax=Saprolegnia parasitica (strain CBS 223.65) TaxID=695850 RepID=A0A067CUB2_SAPPC|nr:hypothetical protein SPRG_19095 [Saprolegnia parasitica CBS 223.65]KDO34274.1 hypothetical protein SPRG_19095 [Saprolegnia parasitica CBS 223.65]|eukprot:XP_012195291.1 hypothetical protein SPRG_19095 [Saprolegnia parasitica CBS 223.65]
MSVLKEVNGPATTAWCPIKRPRDAVLAMGSLREGKHELALYSMNMAVPSRAMERLGSVATSSRFLSVSWADVLKHRASCSLGVIAGGMEDGTVCLWSANKVLHSDPTLLGSVTKHKGAVNAVQFNPRPDSSHLIASGGADGEMYITSLAKLEKPMIFAPGPSIAQAGQEITTVAWNTQAAFIVASGSQSGTTTIWDLKQKQPWCQLHDPYGAPASVIAWSPHEGLQLITASNDDAHPVVRLWDLRGSKTTPLAEFYEHRAGILSAAWNPHDAGFVLTSARDNRTLVWDLHSNQLALEVYDQQADGSYYSGGYERSHVQWSPLSPGLFSAATPASTQVLGVHSLGAQALYAPEWTTQAATPDVSASVANPLALVDAADALEIRGVDGKAFCDYKIGAMDESSVEWGFLKILFADDARKQLLLHLGFDEDEIEAEATRFMDAKTTPGGDPSLPSDPLPIFTRESEEMVKRALLVGNFEAAVECCLRHNQLANALLLATCGGPELWHRTQEAFFQQQQRPFMKIVAAIIKNELATLVQESDVAKWKETLAILSTYSKSEEFPNLCDQLALRLYDAGDVASATLCFICAMNMDRAIAIWADRVHATDDASKPLAILHAVEKISVFKQATGHASSAALPLYSEYASMMLSIGQLDIAAKYGKHDAAIMERLQQGAQPTYAPSYQQPSYQQPYVPEPTHQSPPQPPQDYAPSPEMYQPQQGHHEYEAQPGHHEYPAPQEYTAQQAYAAQHDVAPQPTHEYGLTPPAPDTFRAHEGMNLEPAHQDQPHESHASEAPAAYSSEFASHDDDVPVVNTYEQHGTEPVAYEGVPALQQEAHYLEPPHSEPIGQPTEDAPVQAHSAPPTHLHDAPIEDALHVDTAPKPLLLNAARTKSPAAPKPATPIVAANTPPYVSSVDLSGVHEDDMVVVTAVSGLIGALEMQKLPPMEARQLGEIKKAADVLFTKLGHAADLGDAVLDLIHDLAGGLAARDIKHAQQVHVLLTKDHWAKQKDWLKGLKALIQIAIKRIR